VSPGELRPLAGKLHVSLGGSQRELVFLEVQLEEIAPLTVFAQLVGLQQRLTRLDRMLHGVDGIAFGSLMFAQRPPGVLVRRLGNLGRLDRRFGNLF
jgi:hypothetical protein